MRLQLLDQNSPSDSTMSSREIAELTGKRHDNVMRKLSEMVVSGAIDTPQSEECVNSTGKAYTVARMDKRSSLALVALLSPEFTIAVIDRWQELEANKKPLTGIEMARENLRLWEELDAAEKTVGRLQITLDQAAEWASVKKMEAREGEKFKWQPLKAKSIELGIEIKKVFDANYGTVNTYHAEVWLKAFGVKIS